MKKRILTFFVVLVLMASMVPAALAIPGQNYSGREFTVEVEGRDSDETLYWVGEEITLKSTRTHVVDHTGYGAATGVWLISYTDDINDSVIIAAAGNEDTYTFSQDVEGTFYYFYGQVRYKVDDPTYSVISYSNFIKVETIPPREKEAEQEQEPETAPEEEVMPEPPEEVPYVFPFEDVAEDAWYRNDVLSANKLGLINGKTETQFCPDESITVAEAIKLAACLNQMYTDGEVTLENGTGVWYDTYVTYAEEKGIVDKAYEDYGAAITRKEFVHIFHAAMPESEYAAKNDMADGSVADVAMDSEYADEIYTFYRAGILTGGTDGQFMGESSIKRSEVAAILTRMYDAEARK